MLGFNAHRLATRVLFVGVLLAGLLLARGVAAAGPLDPPAAEKVAEARRIVQEMRENQRGPYSRIAWFCNDGSVQKPVAYACREHGGGRQHAVYSDARERLAALGWSVGTIYAPMDFATLFDSQPRQQRLRELALEQYMIDIDDGWVLHRARGYRGRVQVEDEQASGRALLTQLLSDADWTQANFLLAREASRVIPHGLEDELARTVRRNAVQLAEMDASAERWRAEIHSAPQSDTAQRLRQWASRVADRAVAAFAVRLADDLDSLYGAVGRATRIRDALAALGSSAQAVTFRESINRALASSPKARIDGICAAMTDARNLYFRALVPPRRLALVDAMRELDAEVQLAFREIPALDELSRLETLELSVSLLRCGYAGGFLSESELESVTQRMRFTDIERMRLDAYVDVVGRLKRVPGWTIGMVRHAFAEALLRYGALDPRAARFSDDLLRGSAIGLLGTTLKSLSRDVDFLSGSVVEISGKSVGSAVALNAGVARGTLRIFDTLESLEGATLERGDIAVIPETIAELSPVAGILTLGEGNALSHVQLLARNFGIPNVAVDYEAVALLAPLAGERILMVVTPGGDVLIKADDGDTTPDANAAPGNVTVPVPDLSVRRLLVLDEVGRDMSGRIVGPKAANLGELNRLFPGRVAPAIAIPFGVYAAHLDAAGLTDRIRSAFAARKAGSIDEPAFSAELAAVRSAIAALSLSPDIEAALVETMRAQFGEPGSYGVFIRSDTNVEDLPQFTGAGLNETLANIVDFDAQLKGVPRVWSSVLSSRALAWRSTVLANPEQIYASVLLMKSVPSSKSGVLVTTNLFDAGEPGLTASVAWGVGGAVAGEAAETVTITEDAVETVSEAKSPYQRSIAENGGVNWLPAPAGRVLSADEIGQLRMLAGEVDEKYAPVLDEAGRQRPWDIEFGFVNGELTLFQIRPLVDRSDRSAEVLLARLRPSTTEPVAGDRLVPIDKPTGTASMAP